MKKISFWILLAIAVLIVVGGANSQTKIPGSRIQDGAIDSIHLSDDLLGMLMFEGDTSAIALSVVDGVLTLTDLNTASRDSLKRKFVKYSDSAGVALYIGKAALNDTLQIKSDIRDLIAGRGATPFIYKAKRAAEADSTPLADYAREAGIADSLRGGANQDTVPVSLISLYAVTAGTVIASDTTVGTGAVTWNSFASALKTMIKSDSVQRAMRADSLSAGAFDDTLMFSAGVRSSNIPTSGQKAALGQTITNGAILSEANPVVDSTGLYSNFPVNTEGASRPIHFDLAATPSVVSGNVVSVTIDTVHGRIIVNDMDETRWVFEDSTVIRALITSSLADYVLKGTGGGPGRFTVAAATPSGGSNLDAWINTNDTTLNVKISGTWVEVASGGGGGGTPTSVSTNSFGVVDADSIAFVNQDIAISSAHDWVMNGDLYIGNNTGDLIAQGDIQADTIKGHTSNRFYIASTDTIVGDFQVGRASATPSNGAQPDGYFDSLTVGTLSLTSNNPFTVNNDLMPTTTNHSYIGSSVAQWYRLHSNGIVSEYFSGQNPYHFIYGQNDTILISPDEVQGVKFRNVAVGVYNNDLTVSSGSIVQSGSGSISGAQISAGGTSITSDGITLSSPDSLTVTSGSSIRVQSTGNIIVRSGGEILIKDDSIGFADYDNTAIKYHVVEDSIWAAGIAACPDPSATNPLITKVWFKQMLNDGIYKDDDSIYYYRGNPRNLLYFKSPACDDSLYMGRGDVGIVWPIDSTVVPIEWPDTLQKLILPWFTPGVPVGPYWVDTTAHGIMGIDPDGGLPEHIMRVSERYDSLMGNYTGKWPLLRQAIDSLPTISCRLYKEKLAGDIAVNNDTTNVDTFMIGPRMGVTAQKLDFYRGTVAAASDIAASLPSYMTKPGTYVKFEASSSTINRWNKIESWLNDSTFTVFDPIWNLATIDTAATTVTFAVMPTIEIEPPVKGGYVYLPSAIKIKDVSPVHIKGRDKNTVVLTNVPENGHVASDILFDITGTTLNDAYFGMPIIFSNLTFLTDTSGSATNYAIKVSGNAKFENCNIVGRYRQGQKAMIYHEYSISSVSRPNPPSLVFEDCVIASDSNAILIRITGDSTRFQSDGNVYSIAGDSSYIMWAEGNLVFQPTFSFDQFYFNDDSCLFMGTGASTQTNDSVIVMQSQFINQDPAGTGTGRMFNGDWDGVYVGGNNSYNVLITRPPAKVAEGSMPVDVPFLPKK